MIYPKKKNEVSRNDVAEVTLSSQVLIPVDNFNDNPSTSRFSIIDGFEVVGGGIINADNYPNQRKLINFMLARMESLEYSMKN